MDLSCPSCRHPIPVKADASTGDHALISTIASVECPNCGQVPVSLDTDLTVSYVQPENDASTVVAHFSLIRLLGCGGFGKVWLAQDNNLERPVALKLPVSPDQETETLMHEARAVATLHHPNIVSVYEVGNADSQVFIASEYIEGMTLADLISAGKPKVNRTVEVIAAIARGLQHAHENGIIHRDVKPANILIDHSGNPLICDFGLAKRISADQSISANGQILGTARYMSPEQAAGMTSETDHRSDIYSLGVILFQMLTAELPFRGTIQAVLQRKTLEESPSPRTFEPNLAKDLETICAKCLEIDPSKRYQAASEVADEVALFQAGKPIKARAISTIERVWRWCRRRPAVASLLAGLFLSLTLGLLGVSVFWLRAENVAEQNRMALYRSQMNLASEYAAKGDITGVAQTLDRFIPNDGHADLREFAWEYYSQTRSLFAGYWNQGAPVVDVCISNDGGTVSALGIGRSITVFDSKTEDVIQTLSIETGRFAAIASSPSNTQLASGSSDGMIRIWNPRKSDQPLQQMKHGPTVLYLQYSSNGKLLLSASKKGAVRIWDLKKEAVIAEIPTGNGENKDVRLSPNAQLVAVAKEDGRVRITEVASGIVKHQLQPNPNIEAIAWAPDGITLATGSYSGAIRIWSIDDEKQTLEVRTSVGLIGNIRYINEQTVAVVGTSGHLFAVDIKTGHESFHIPTHNLTQGLLDISNDGRTIVVGSGDGSIKLLNVKELLAPSVLWHASDVRHVSFVDSRSLLTASSDGILTLWDINDGDSRRIHENRSTVRVCATQHDGGLVAVSGTEPVVSIISVEKAELEASIRLPNAGIITSIVFSDDDRQLAIGQRDGTLTCYLTSDWTKQQTKIREIGNGINDLSFSPDGQTIAVACADQSVHFFEVATGKPKAWSISLESTPLAATYCENGKLLAIGTSTGDLQLWEAKTQTRRATIKAHTSPISDLAVFPNGTTLVSGGRDRVLRLWDTSTGERLTTLRGHGRQVFSINVSRDGENIASGGLAGDARIWRSGR
jgi:eukaryotic-like serine/threonine-protein kinase